MTKIIKNFETNKEAVSPVVGVILMVAITVVMAAIIGIFVFDIMPEEPAILANIDVDVENNRNFTVRHMGGDSIPSAFNNAADNEWNTGDWANLEVRINGAVVGVGATGVADLVNIPNEFNGLELPTGVTDFEGGDVMRFGLDTAVPNLVSGDIIAVVHVPTGHILVEHTVVLET